MKYPNNKTAKICYGRAVGLSGNPQQSTEIFNKLLVNYPKDVEVELNLAESHLWQGNPDSAIPIYRSLLKNDSLLFSAQLGLANSLSMQQAYREAYKEIKKAIVLNPENDQSKLSAKFIRLGYANVLASVEQKFDSAIALIDENLAINAQDQESLTLLANIFLISKDFEKSKGVYAKLQDPLTSLKGESTALHFLKKDKKALSKILAGYNRKWSEEELILLQLHHIIALLWNDELRLARLKIDSLSQQYSENPEVTVTEAEVAMYEGDFMLGIEKFDAYLESKPMSFKGNLGKANALSALNADKDAYKIGIYTSHLFQGQKDVESFLSKLDKKHSPTLQTAYTQGKASDGSIIYAWKNDINASLSPHTALRR